MYFADRIGFVSFLPFVLIKLWLGLLFDWFTVMRWRRRRLLSNRHTTHTHTHSVPWVSSIKRQQKAIKRLKQRQPFDANSQSEKDKLNWNEDRVKKSGIHAKLNSTIQAKGELNNAMLLFHPQIHNRVHSYIPRSFNANERKKEINRWKNKLLSPIAFIPLFSIACEIVLYFIIIFYYFSWFLTG